MSHIENMGKSIECVAEELHKQISGGSNDVKLMSDLADMLKDIAEAKYKCAVVKAMEDAEEDGELREKIMDLTSDDAGTRFYNRSRSTDGRYAPSGYERRNYEPMYYGHPMDTMRETDRQGRMYYGGNANSGNIGSMPISNGNAGSRAYTESRYDRARRGYTESKDMHKANTAEDKQAKMKELENYAKELTEDVTDMINDATPEERTLLRNKINLLAQKI